METIVLVAIITGVCNIVATVLSRRQSRGEHKQTARDVNEIKIFINGERDRLIAEAKEQGRVEEREKQNKTSL